MKNLEKMLWMSLRETQIAGSIHNDWRISQRWHSYPLSQPFFKELTGFPLFGSQSIIHYHIFVGDQSVVTTLSFMVISMVRIEWDEKPIFIPSTKAR
jgi:hypothetical protein